LFVKVRLQYGWLIIKTMLIMKKTSSVYLIAALLAAQGCTKVEEKPLGAQAQTEASVQAAVSTQAISDYDLYTLQCVAGGKFIEVSGSLTQNEKYADGALLEQYSASTTNSKINGWQKWQMVYRVTTGGVKYYQLRNAFSGKLLTVPSATTKAGTQLQQYLEFTVLADQQLWRIDALDNVGNYRITNKGNGLAITNPGASVANGTAITQEVTNSAANEQKWTFALQPAEAYRDDQVVQFFNRDGSNQGSVAFDEGLSIPLSSGKVLWVTEDAFDGSSLNANNKLKGSDFFSYRNSLLLQPSTTDWSSTAPNVTVPGGAHGRVRQVFADQSSDGSTAFGWPGAGVEIDNHVYIQCAEGYGSGTIKRQSLYDFTEGAGTQWTTVRTLPKGMSDQSQITNDQTTINYAKGMVKAADGYVYVFGTATYYSTDYVNVARFKTTDPQTWTFWNGSTWASKPDYDSDAQIATAKASTNVSYVNGKYVLLTLDNGYGCGDSRNVYMATATKPTGPFTALKQVYSIKEYMYGKYARFYTPGIHPEAVNGRDELLITYCLNFSACGVSDQVNGERDPYFYRVKGVRVPYSVLGL